MQVVHAEALGGVDDLREELAATRSACGRGPGSERACQYRVRGTSAWPARGPRARWRAESGVGVGAPFAQRVEHAEVAVGGADAVETEHDGEQAAVERLEQLVEHRVPSPASPAVRRDLHEHAEGRAGRLSPGPRWKSAAAIRPGRRARLVRVAGLELRERQHRPREQARTCSAAGLLEALQVRELTALAEQEALHQVHARRAAVRAGEAAELVAVERASANRPSSRACVVRHCAA